MQESRPRRFIAHGVLAGLAAIALQSWHPFKGPSTAADFAREGLAFLGKGELGEAELRFRRGLRLDPLHLESRLHLAETLSLRGKLDAGLAILALDEPGAASEAETRRALGVSLNRAGRLPEAAAQYWPAIRLQPRFADSYLDCAAIFLQLERPDEAVALLRLAVAIRPKFLEAWNRLGTAFGTLGRYDEAAVTFRNAITLNPKFVPARNNLGLALARQGDLARAVEEYRGALAVDPDFTDARANLGMALAGLGKKSEANAEFRKVLRVRPGDEKIRKALGN